VASSSLPLPRLRPPARQPMRARAERSGSDRLTSCPLASCRWTRHLLPPGRPAACTNVTMVLARFAAAVVVALVHHRSPASPLSGRPPSPRRSPDAAKVKQKMVYASSKDALKKKLNVTTEIQATDLDEVAYETVFDKVARRGN